MIGAAMNRLPVAFQARRYDETLRLAEQRLELLAAEGIATPKMVYSAEFDAFYACKCAGKHSEARAWLLKAQMHAVMADGPESTYAQLAIKLLAEP